MGIRKFKPATPASRFRSVLSFQGEGVTEPEKQLLVSKTRCCGRNNNGRITVRWRGGAHKRSYRLVDFHRRNDAVVGKVAGIQYDPNRSARIALLHNGDGSKCYMICPNGLKLGATVQTGVNAPIAVGNSSFLGNIPVGEVVHNVELQPGGGGKMARSAGTFVQIVARLDKKYALLRLPSGEQRKVLLTCRATVGMVGNSDHMNVSIGKAGKSRWLGRRPNVRGVAMNPVDHPHGGGEGKTSGGRHPCTPWGKPTKGLKTRKNKRTNVFIVKRRK